MPKSSSSPFASAARRKAGVSRTAGRKADAGERLDDVGVAPSLATPDVPQDVVGLVRHVQAHAWTPVPDRAAGMGSERVSAVLRFRVALPPVVSLAHLLALAASPTAAERELARLVAAGAVRSLTVPGRGTGGAAVGAGVVLADDWTRRVRDHPALSDPAKRAYLALLDTHPVGPSVPTAGLSPAHLGELVRAGFLTNPSALSAAPGDPFARSLASSSSSPRPIADAGATAATGTLAAVGGPGAIHSSGALATAGHRPSAARHPAHETMTLSLPSTGPYLRLLTSARQHLLALLKQISPRHREATRDLLREKWDGNVSTTDPDVGATRRPGAVLPGKTRKWREFYGLRFEWVLEECVGSGLVELFDTGSVGIGVRAT